MSAILHVTKAGHKCHNPLRGKVPPASYIKAGEFLSLGDFELSYNHRQQVYVVHVNMYPYGVFDYYEFHSYNCAVAKLAELGA